MKRTRAERIAGVNAKRPRNPLVVARASSGVDRVEELIAELLRQLDSAPPGAQG